MKKRPLNKKGKVCVAAFWVMLLSLIAFVGCFVLGLYKVMYFSMWVAALAFLVFYILSPQKYVDREDRLYRKH